MSPTAWQSPWQPSLHTSPRAAQHSPFLHGQGAWRRRPSVYPPVLATFNSALLVCGTCILLSADFVSWLVLTQISASWSWCSMQLLSAPPSLPSSLPTFSDTTPTSETPYPSSSLTLGWVSITIRMTNGCTKICLHVLYRLACLQLWRLDVPEQEKV